MNKTSTLQELRATSLFHRINSVLPDDQELETLSLQTKASDAIEFLSERGYSQVPVVDLNNKILGVFSFRSFSQGMLELVGTKQDVGQLLVESFLEKANYARLEDEFRKVFSDVDRFDAVFIDGPQRHLGIVTAMDILKYLYKLASPYVLIAEIELSLRALIRRSASEEQITVFIKNSLSKLYVPESLPTTLEELTFSDYSQLLNNKLNWSYLGGIFGGAREHVNAKLEWIRKQRNKILHFKGDISVADYERLVGYRDWLLQRTELFEGQTEDNTDE